MPVHEERVVSALLKVAKRLPARSSKLTPEGPAYAAGQAAELIPRERARGPLRVNPSGKERFGRVDVAETRNPVLIHEKYFDGSARFSRELEERRRGELAAQGLDAESLETTPLRVTDDAKLPETPDVNEGDALAAREPDNGAREPGQAGTGRNPFERPGHTEMHEHSWTLAS